MKKFISVILAVIMIFSVSAVFAFAADADKETYEITFADFPYDVRDFRDDYVADYMGYEYGVDYWFSVTNNKDGYITVNGIQHPVSAGTTTDIKGAPTSITVEEGTTLEFSVSVADYVEAQTVRVITFPTGTANEDLAELDPLSTNLSVTPGEPFAQYYISKSVAGTYGIKPTEDMTVCVSEYHLYNSCFLYDFPTSDFYTANRLIYRGEDLSDESLCDLDSYDYVEWGNTRVVYENETLYFEVRMDMNSEYDLHYDTYQVYYIVDDMGSLVGQVSGAEKIYLTPIHREYVVDEETGKEEQVDIYAIENVSPYTTIKVTNTVTYTLDMLSQFISDFDLNNLSDIDLDSVDLSPMLALIVRIAKLIVKMLNGFGLNVSLGDILG